MSSPPIQQNLIPNDISELRDLLNLFKKEIFSEFNCHAVAQIQSFDNVKQTASVSINYKKTIFVSNSNGVTPRLVDYPVIIDCPVIVLGGNKGALTFPIDIGDDCLVFFNDRSIDNWFQGSKTSPVATPRMHSFSDAIILVGLRNANAFLPSYSTTDIELRSKNGQVKLAINSNGDYIKAQIGSDITLQINDDGKATLTNGQGELFSALNTMLTEAFVVTMLGNQPIVFPAPELAVFQSFIEGV